MKAFVARHQTGAFLAVTFGIAWPLWFASGALRPLVAQAPDLHWLLAQLGVFAPALAGMVVATCVEPGAGRIARRTLLAIYAPAALIGLGIATCGYGSFAAIGPRWTLALAALGIWILVWFGSAGRRLAAWPRASASTATVAGWTLGSVVVPVGLYVVGWLIVGPTAASAGPGPPLALGAPAVSGLLTSVAVNLVFGGSLGEEPGWRGVWLPRLLHERGAGEAALMTGIAWALWHAPIDLTQGLGLKGAGALFVRLLWTLPVALLFTWITVRAGGNLLPAFAFHTGLNALPDFFLVDPGRYQRALGILWLFFFVAAVAIPLADRRFAAEVRLEPERGGDRA